MPLGPGLLPREARISRRDARTTNKIRFPRTRIQPEVADLFNFAGQATDNMLLAFLNYYQTLEYFMPAAVRQGALKRIRRELRDPKFDEDSDQSILRIASAAERSINMPEAAQIRVLVAEYVRRDVLEDFFKHDWGNYFSKRGPIEGVPAISLESPEFLNHVADRIYQIRNRIVHAKDDPRYQEARVLLPLSQGSRSPESRRGARTTPRFGCDSGKSIANLEPCDEL